MESEIDLLIGAASKGLLVVEKDSNVNWSMDDLGAVRAEGRFDEVGSLNLPDPQPADVTSVFPGCMQQAGAAEEYSCHVLVGQTRHFLLFAKPEV